MADTTYISKITTIVTAWLQAVNNFIYRGVDPKYVVSTGAANAYTITLPGTSLLAALTAGSMFTFKANFGNTGPTTLTVVGSASLGPYAIQQAGVGLTGGEIGNNAVITVLFDGTAFQLTGFGIALPIPITLGGTGAVTAAAARTSLGSTAVGDAVFIAANAAAGRNAIGAAALAGSSTQDFAAQAFAVTGTISSTKACAAGYSRVAPNLCMRQGPLPAHTVLPGPPVMTQVTAPAGATGIILEFRLSAVAKNATGYSYSNIKIYADNSSNFEIGYVEGWAFEQVAVAAGTILARSTPERHLKCDVSGSIWLLTEILGAGGEASYRIVGYYD